MGRKLKAKGSPWKPSKAIGDIGFTIGTESGGNVINVGLQLKNQNGKDLAVRAALDAWLSSDAEGDDIVASAPGTVAIGTDGVYMPIITGKLFKLVSEADGDIDLNITQTGGVTIYLNVCMPDGTIKTSGAITFAA